MGAIPNKATRVRPRPDVMAQALKELAPKWARFEKGLEPHQWAWEFLSRNKKFQPKRDEALLAFHKWHSEKDMEALDRALTLMKEICDEFGLFYPLADGDEMSDEQLWDQGLNAKSWSQAKAAGGFIGAGTYKVTLKENEALMIINFDAPCQAYIKDLKKMYNDRGLKDDLPPFQISKFASYLKVYDLREWGKKNSKEKGKSSIGWKEIGIYLSPRTPVSVQAVRKQYAAAQDFIDGGYKRLVKYKT